jgi:hypothetical protein
MAKATSKTKVVDTISIPVTEHAALVKAAADLATCQASLAGLAEMQQAGELIGFEHENAAQAAIRTIRTLKEERFPIACPLTAPEAAATAFATMWAKLDQIRMTRKDLSPIQQRMTAFVDGANVLIAATIAQARFDAVSLFANRLAAEQSSLMQQSNDIVSKSTIDAPTKNRLVRELQLRARAFEDAQILLGEVVGAGGVATPPTQGRPVDSTLN